MLGVNQCLYLSLFPPPHLCQIRHHHHKGVIEGDEGDEDCDVAVAVGKGVAVLYVLKVKGKRGQLGIYELGVKNCLNNASDCTYV